MNEHDIERELDRRFPAEDEKRRVYDMDRAISDMARDRSHNSIEEDDGGIDSERSRIYRNIDQRRTIERIEDEEAARVAAQNANDEALEYQWEQEQAELQREYDEDPEMHILNPEEIFETFTEDYEDVWQNKEHRQALMDAIDLRIAETLRDGNDYRSYNEIGQEFRKRMKDLDETPELAVNFEREDAMARIDVKNLRSTLESNAYSAASLPKDSDSIHDDITGPGRDAIQETFAEEYPDVVSNPNSLIEAINYVNKTQQKEKIETGNFNRSLGLYQNAGEHSRRRNAIEEIARSRGQDADDI